MHAISMGHSEPACLDWDRRRSRKPLFSQRHSVPVAKLHPPGSWVGPRPDLQADFSTTPRNTSSHLRVPADMLRQSAHKARSDCFHSLSKQVGEERSLFSDRIL